MEMETNVKTNPLEDLPINQPYSGLFFVTSSITKSGGNGMFVTGNLHAKFDLGYKVWNTSVEPFEYMTQNNCVGKVCNVSGVIKEYNGKYLDIKTIEITDEDVEPYLEVKYQVEKYEQAFWLLLEKNMSDDGLALIKKILCEDDPSIYERFTKEFAAKTFHDNCLYGLLAHTCKCMTFLQLYLKQYPLMIKYKGEDEEQNLKDLYFIGMALHDIGKIQELHYGAYQHRAMITHRVIGLEMIFPYKEQIIEMYSAEWYDFLLSIISQHHAAFGEDARSLPAMVIHMIDNLDSTSTYLANQLDGQIKPNECGDTIYYQVPETIRKSSPYFTV